MKKVTPAAPPVTPDTTELAPKKTWARKGGRPRKTINCELLQKLAAQALPLGVCCELAETSETSVRRHPKAYAAWQRGRAQCKDVITYNLLELSKTNAAVAIFLAKAVVGLRDDEVTGDETPQARLVIDETEAEDGDA